nr:ribosomal protein L16, mitochondrial [Tanacetum cinerariifolium]
NPLFSIKMPQLSGHAFSSLLSIAICNDGDGLLGISRILKLCNQLLSHRANNIQKVRMGRGKGNPAGCIARVSTGQIPFEMDGVSLSNARRWKSELVVV